MSNLASKKWKKSLLAKKKSFIGSGTDQTWTSLSGNECSC